MSSDETYPPHCSDPGNDAYWDARAAVRERIVARIDTETNRQAILAHVHAMRAKGSWPSPMSAAQVLRPRPLMLPGEEIAMPREFLDSVREVCRRMGEAGILTFSAHGYMGIGEMAPF